MKAIAIFILAALFVGCTPRYISLPNPVEQALVSNPPKYSAEMHELDLGKYKAIGFTSEPITGKVSLPLTDYELLLELLAELRKHIGVQQTAIQEYDKYYAEIVSRSKLRETDLVVPAKLQMDQRK